MPTSLTLAVDPAIPRTPLPQASDAFLRLDGLNKRYGSAAPTVDNLKLDLPRGKLLGLLGPSGCGKTTTLRMIAGLLPITDGRILVDEQDISRLPPHQRDMGLVFQSYALFPHMTVSENVAFGLQMRGIDKQETARRVEEALETVRLAGYGLRKPKELSGGQQQRVALARALVIRPRLLLLDEPLSNLDAQLRDELRVEIRQIQQKLGITTVFVTHDQTEALTMCDLVGVMSGGKLAQLGTPEEIYERPASLFVAQFVGRTNVLTGEMVGRSQVRIGQSIFGCNGKCNAGDSVKVVVRPHRISITPYRDRSLVSTVANSINGRVVAISYVGDLIEYDIDVGDDVLKVEMHTASGGQKHGVGDRVMCEWSQDDFLAFEG